MIENADLRSIDNPRAEIRVPMEAAYTHHYRLEFRSF